MHMDAQVFEAKLESRLSYWIIQLTCIFQDQFLKILMHQALPKGTGLIPAI